MKHFKTTSGVTITFEKKVAGQDVYATDMKLGVFNDFSGQTIQGDPEQDGYCFLIREETEIRWSHSATGKLVEI